MRKFLILGIIIFAGCNDVKEQTALAPTAIPEVVQPYSEFQKSLQAMSETEKKKFFFRYINEEVPQYWTGTPWTFNGTSSEPQKGSVACGYFVTNVLKNYGFDLKAAYLAQQPSSVMIRKLCTDIRYFTSVSDVEKYLHAKDRNQVYIKGLDFHTGFVTREINDTYFIHSSYIGNKGVVKEKTGTSEALHSSKTFMIGNLKF